MVDGVERSRQIEQGENGDVAGIRGEKKVVKDVCESGFSAVVRAICRLEGGAGAR